MITIGIIIISILFGAGYFIASRTSKGTPKIGMPITIIAVGLILGLCQPYSLSRVDAGHVGIKVNLTGDSRGVSNYEYKTGWVTFNTWTEQLYEFPTFQQHIEYDTINVITKGGFSAKITPSFNYSLIPNAVGDMFQNLRKPIGDVEQGWLKNAIYSSVNDIANRWAVDSIFNYREQFESSIIVECNKRVSRWFTVSQLRSNIIPPPALQSSIVAKTKAIQEVQVAENNKKVAIAQGETNVATAELAARTAIAKARGDSASAVIAAKGEAEAIKAKQMTLSQLYIDYIRATTWDGKLPNTVLGSNTSALINMK